MRLLTTDDLETIEQMIIKSVRTALPKPVPYTLTKKQLAEYVQKPISTIDRWMKQGMPFHKETETSFPEFIKPEVDKWMEDRFSAQESEVIQ